MRRGRGAPTLESHKRCVLVVANDDRLGRIASMALNPATSRVLLKLAPTETDDPKAIQRYLDLY